MGMPTIVFTSQHVTVFSPGDTAIDSRKSGKKYEKYCMCEDLDVSKLTLKKGDKPVEFVIRALAPNENDVVGCLVYGDEAAADETAAAQRERLNAIEVLLHSVRFGLVEVKGLDGWENAKRSRVNGSTVDGWTEETVGSIDSETRLFLGRAILSLSRLDEKKDLIWLMAHAPRWNRGAKSKTGKRSVKPFDCRRCQKSEALRAQLGCDAPLERGWHERSPIFEVEIDRCPMYYLRRDDAWRDYLLRLWNDYEVGLVPGWPDDFNNQFVEGLHYLRAQIRESEARYMEEA